MRNLNLNKKSQAQVITTILIILLVLAVIVIVYNVVKNVVETSSSGVGTEQFAVSLSASKIGEFSDDPIQISVTRSPGKGEITALKFICTDENGNSKEVEKTDCIPDELETQTCEIDKAPDFNEAFFDPVFCDVYPLIKKGDTEVIGMKASQKQIPGPGCDDDCSPGETRCDDDCSPGETRCDGNIEQTCGNYNADDCLGWPLSTTGNGNYDCSDCSCSCGDYNVEGLTTNNNCDDEIDNDCDGLTDCDDSDCSSDYNCIINSASAISYWKFESIIGSVTPDEKKLNNGTLIGNAEIISDAERGNVLSLDGDKDYVNIPLTASLNTIGDKNWTLSAWIKPADVAGINKWFIGNHQGTGDPAYDGGITLYAWGTTVQFQVRTGTATISASKSGVLSLDTWVHLVGVYNGTSVALYVDGSLKNVKSMIPINGLQPTSQNWRIGASGGSSTQTWNGLIDEVMIFDKALSSEEIQAIYNYQKYQK